MFKETNSILQYNNKVKINEDLDTEIIAIDCEMLETEDLKDFVSQISITNHLGQSVLNCFIIPPN